MVRASALVGILSAPLGGACGSDGGGDSGRDAAPGQPDPGALIEPCAARGTPGPINPAGAAVNPTGIYSNWWWPDTPLTSLEWQLGIETEPSDGYFWSHQFAFQVEGGYLGLQMNGGYQADPPGGPVEITKMAVFSIAGPAITAETGDISYPDARVFGDFDGAPGWNVHARFDWVRCRVYRLRVAQLETEGEGNIWFGGFVRDEVTGVETLIGRILVPASYVGLSTWSVMWTERFGPSQLQSCDQLGPASAIFGIPTANGGAVSPHDRTSVFSDPTSCPSSRFTAVANGVRQEVGVAPAAP